MEDLSMTNRLTALFAAVAFIVCGVSAAEAAHKDVKHCANDYKRYCHEWGLETKGLTNCMRKHGDTLSNACVAALVKAGEVSQAEVDRRKKALGR
jgi:hypothetical protein